MSYRYEIFDNKGWIYNLQTLKYQNSNLIKLFDSDIIDNQYNLLESKIRDKYLVGIFSTSQTQRFGKNKRGNIIYLVKSLESKLPNFLISYGGKLKGKIAVKFKFSHWNEKLPTGEIIDVIGNYSSENMTKILLHHYNVYPKKIRASITDTNPLEQQIERKEYSSEIFSIDPDDCMDIDDSLSIENNKNYTIIGVHIAQPNYWLNLEDLDNKVKYQFSTLYTSEERKDLWGKDLTYKASLFEGEKKPAYTTLYYYNSEYKLVKTEDFPSWIINKKKLSYNNANNYCFAIELKEFTNKLSNVLDYHEVVSHWMLKTNNYIGNKFSSNKIPYRVNNEISNPDLLNLQNLSEDIRKKFTSKNIEAACYSIDENVHQTLGLENYCHFTSPIRRFIDTWIHFYVTYPSIRNTMNIDCSIINNLDKQTKKFHRQLELDNTITKLFSDSNKINTVGYIYKIISDNVIEIYIPPINGQEFGFIKLRLFDIKFDYIINKTKTETSIILEYNDNVIEYNIGDNIKVIINKMEGILPKDKINIYPINQIITI